MKLGQSDGSAAVLTGVEESETVSERWQHCSVNCLNASIVIFFSFFVVVVVVVVACTTLAFLLLAPVLLVTQNYLV